MVWRVGAVVVIAVLLAYSGTSLGPVAVVGGHATQCSSQIVEVRQGGDDGSQSRLVAWQYVSDFGTYEFNVSPGDYFVVGGAGAPVEVHVTAGERLTQDVSCQ